MIQIIKNYPLSIFVLLIFLIFLHIQKDSSQLTFQFQHLGKLSKYVKKYVIMKSLFSPVGLDGCLSVGSHQESAVTWAVWLLQLQPLKHLQFRRVKQESEKTIPTNNTLYSTSGHRKFIKYLSSFNSEIHPIRFFYPQNFLEKSTCIDTNISASNACTCM